MQPAERSVVADSLGVGIATGAYGVSFGAIATASGLDVWQACALSLLVFTGASQFAFVGVLASGGSAVAAVATATLLGTRNTFYGLSLAGLLGLRGTARLAGAHLVIDESTAMAVTREDARTARVGFWWTGGSVFVLWNVMTLVGALAGEALGDPRTYGLDAAIAGAFLALLWPRLGSPRTRAVAATGAGAAAALVPWTPAGVPIIAGGAVAVVLGLLLPGRRTT